MSQPASVPPPQVTAFEHRFVPAREPSRRLMVVLHGLGDSLEGFLWLPELLGLPAVNYLLLNAPFPYYFLGYAWFDLDDPVPGVTYSRGQLRTLFAELAGQGWSSGETMLFGFSQGCLVSIDFALRHEQPLAGVVGVSGYVLMPEDVESTLHPQARRQAWLVTHGMYDELLPVSRTRAQIQQLQAAGVPVEWHEFPKAHTIDPDAELPLLRRWIAARWNAVARAGT